MSSRGNSIEAPTAILPRIEVTPITVARKGGCHYYKVSQCGDHSSTMFCRPRNKGGQMSDFSGDISPDPLNIHQSTGGEDHQEPGTAGLSCGSEITENDRAPCRLHFPKRVPHNLCSTTWICAKHLIKLFCATGRE